MGGRILTKLSSASTPSRLSLRARHADHPETSASSWRDGLAPVSADRGVLDALRLAARNYESFTLAFFSSFVSRCTLRWLRWFSDRTYQREPLLPRRSSVLLISCVEEENEDDETRYCLMIQRTRKDGSRLGLDRHTSVQRDRVEGIGKAFLHVLLEVNATCRVGAIVVTRAALVARLRAGEAAIAIGRHARR